MVNDSLADGNFKNDDLMINSLNCDFIDSFDYLIGFTKSVESFKSVK